MKPDFQGINPNDVASFYTAQAMANINYEQQVSSQITNAVLGTVLKKLESLDAEKALEVLDSERERRKELNDELLKLSNQLTHSSKEI